MPHTLDRRRFLGTAGLGAAALGLPHRAIAGQPAERRPNVIFILADDLGYGDLSCQGQTKFQTPHIDRLAADGMRFTQHYAGSTVCAPSRCALMTGLHTGHAYIRGNKELQPEGQEPLPAATRTVAKLMRDAGYRTGLVGKWGLGGPATEGVPTRQGFDDFYGHLCQREAHYYYPPHLWRNEEKVILEGNDRAKQTGHYAHDLLVEEALSRVAENRDRPFFLYLAFTIPHAELAAPEDSMAAFRGKFPEKPFPGQHYGAQPTPRAAFAAMVTRMDRAVGRLVALLQELGLDDHTLVLFSSDNGPHKEGGHDPDFFDSNGPLRGVKRDLYEGGIRVPLIARWPGRIAAGATSDHVSAFWDFLPTCAELAGVAAPDATDGLSYLPTLVGRPADQKRHDQLYWEFHEGGFKQAVRAGDWKAIRQKPGGPLELYDLKNDIGEQHDLAKEKPDVVAQLADRLATARTESPIWKVKGESTARSGSA